MLTLKHHPLLAFLVIFAAMGTFSLRADVFRTLRGSANDRLAALGGQVLYTSEATVNGTPAHLTLFGFSGAPAEQTSTLARSLGLELPRGRADGFLLTGTVGGERLHLLTLPADLDKTLAIVITQPPARNVPATPPPWPDLPRPAGAELIFTASLAATRTSLVVASLPRPPAAVASETDTLLRDAGWGLAAPTTPSFTLYQRRNATCALLTQPGDSTGTARITLLQRLGRSP